MNKPRILIVDDKEENRYLLRTLLQGHGYEVAVAAHGAEALDAARKQPPGLIISDVLMPVMDGFALCREWKNDARLARIPFVFYTATYTDERDRRFGLSLGAERFIVKPEEPDALLAIIRETIREIGVPPAAGRPAPAAAGNDERVFLKQYNEALVRKLETKMEELRRDIAAREVAQNALRESEEKHRLLVENAQEAIYVVQHGAIAFANAAFARMAEMEMSAALGATVLDFVPPEDRDEVRAHHRRLVAGEIPGGVLEVRMRTRKGAERWMSINAVRILWGDQPATLNFATDITARKRTEQILQESEIRYRELFGNMASGVAVYEVREDGADFVFKDINQAGLAIAGVKREEVIGKPVTEVFPGIREMGLLDVFRRVWKTGVSEQHPASLYVDGRLSHWYENHVYKMPSDEIVAVYDNITARKQAEAAREKLQAQLNQAQKMESVGRLAGGVAHDFNNMLSVILGHAEMALEVTAPNQPIHADLEEIRKAAERSADLTRQLLAFARKQTIATKVLDLNETVNGMLNMLRRLIGENIKLDWRPGPDLWPVKMDPGQIDQILANLCVNARDAIGPDRADGRIAIETGTCVFSAADAGRLPGLAPGDYVRLVVGDNGCGMDRETLENLFEPFFTTKGVGKGTGLGLATVYGAIKQNHGYIEVASEPGRGTTFRIYLPRHRDKTGTILPEAPAASPAQGGETILLVEDEPAILSIGKTMLERLGYRVLGAATPGEAIRVAEDHSGEIHLLMTDVVMPEMNGRDLAKNLLSIYPNLKRLFMSGYTANVIAHHGVLHAGVDFIQKPFSMNELSAKVRHALENKSAGP